MKLYTKKGDDGYTGILGKDRLSKDDARIEAYGTVDELNSIISVVLHHTSDTRSKNLRKIQHLLFEIGSELASVKPRMSISENDISFLEELIDKASSQVPELTSFILPGGSLGASWLHFARTVTRRTERRVVTLQKSTDLNPQVIIFLNRLSDLFFAWARLENHENEVGDIEWKARQ